MLYSSLEVFYLKTRCFISVVSVNGCNIEIVSKIPKLGDSISTATVQTIHKSKFFCVLLIYRGW